MTLEEKYKTIPCYNCMMFPKCSSIFNDYHKSVSRIIYDALSKESATPRQKFNTIQVGVLLYPLIKKCGIISGYIYSNEHNKKLSKCYFISNYNEEFKKLIASVCTNRFLKEVADE